MSDDWKPGDLALCVTSGPWSEEDWGNQPGPDLGSINTVDFVEMLADSLGPALCLNFVEWPGQSGGYEESNFRKIKPLNDEEREQFVADLNVREPANA